MRTVHDRSENMLEQLWRSVRLRTWVNDQPYDTVQRRIEHEALAQRTAADAGARASPPCGASSPRRTARSACSRTASTARPRGGGGASCVALGHVRAATPAADADVVPATTHPLDRALVADVWRQVEALHRDRIAHRNLDLNDVWVTPSGRAVLRGLRRRRHRRQRPRPGPRPGPAAGVHRAGDGRHGRGRGGGRRDRARGGHDRRALPAAPRAPVAHPAGVARQQGGARQPCARAIARPPGSSLPRSPASTGSGPAPRCRWRRSPSPSTSCCPSSATSARRPRRPARPTGGGWAPMILGAAATIVFAALSFVASVPEPIPFLPALRMQMASSFVSRIAPANTGTLAVGRALPAAVGPRPRARPRRPSGCRRWRASWSTCA